MYACVSGICAWGVRFNLYTQVASSDGQLAAPPEPANGPGLSSEASIEIACATNKLNHLRFVAQAYACTFRQQSRQYVRTMFAAHRCVRPTISAQFSHCGVRNWVNRSDNDAVRSGLVDVPLLLSSLWGPTRALPKRLRFHTMLVFSLWCVYTPITGQETAH